MKKDLNKIFVLLTLFILLTGNMVWSQPVFTIADSVLFEAFKNDTTKLREFTNRLGSRIALKSHNRLGFLNFKEQKYQNANIEFLRSKNARPESPEGKEALYFLGRIAGINNNHIDSKNYLAEYLQKEPNGVWSDGAHYFLITSMVVTEDNRLLTEMKNFMLERPVAYYSKDVQYQITKYFRDSGDYLNAVREAKKLLEIYPESNYAKDFVYQLGDFYMKLGQKEEAKNHYRKIIMENQVNTEPPAIAQYLLAEVYESENNFNTARIEYLKVKENHPGINHWVILSEFSTAMSYYKEYLINRDTILLDETFEKLTNFCEQYPTDKRTPSALITLANLYKEKKDWENAVDYYNSVFNFNISTVTNSAPDADGPNLNYIKKLKENSGYSLGLIFHFELQQYNDALTVYDSILIDNPLRTDVKLNKALIFLELERKTEAIILLEEIVQAGGKEGESALNLLILTTSGGN